MSSSASSWPAMWSFSSVVIISSDQPNRSRIRSLVQPIALSRTVTAWRRLRSMRTPTVSRLSMSNSSQAPRLEFDIDKRDTVGVRIDRKRRQAVTVLLKAIGWTNERIRERFGWSELMMTTLEKDHIAGQDEALLDIYRKLRPGEPPTRENAQNLLDNLFFNPKRYDLAKVGRYKVNKKLEIDVPIETGTLTQDDIVATVEYLCRLHTGEDGYEPDDIDHFGNRRLRTVGELIQNQVRVGLSRMRSEERRVG